LIALELVYVLSGVIAGTFAGLLPGIGVLTTLILSYPFLHGADIIQLILFYMALAATVQFTGTIPAVFAGLPGENNSIPAVHEGAKFARRYRSDIAVGVCALGSAVGAVVAVLIFMTFSSYALPAFSTVISTRFHSILFLIVMGSFLVFFNHRRVHVNLALITIGMIFGMVGESPVVETYRWNFGIDDLQQGFAKVPFVSGLLVMPILFKKYAKFEILDHSIRTTFVMPMVAFLRNITSSIRGSVLGFVCGLVPGVTTMLASTMSHTIESRLHPNRPVRKIIAAETGNNSGQFASLLPLLLFGIPITGSEIFLYHMLVDAGWNPDQFEMIGENVTMIFQTVLPYFVMVNVLGVMISWPMAKYSMVIFRMPYVYIAIFVTAIIVLANWYLGYNQFRSVSFLLQLAFFSIIGICLRKYDILPAVAAFLLSDKIEAVAVREYIFMIH
jgi:putative tricarboxylic transport membrane protein